MKKVLFVSHTTDFVKFNIPYLKWFKEQKWEVHYASMEEKNFPEGIVDYHFKIPFSRSPFRFENIKAYKKLKKLVEQENYDLIHCHTPVGGAITRLAAQKARNEIGTKVVYTGHGFHFYKGAPFFNWILYYPVEKLMAKYSDAVVTINYEDYELAKKNFTCPVYHIHGVGVDLNKFYPVNEEEKHKLRAKYGFQENDFLMIYAAELNKNKNQVFLIKVMPEILRIIPNVKLLLAGQGDKYDEFESLTEKLKLQKKVYLLGYRNDIDKLYQMSDIGVSASKREGLPLNILEEMSCGLPIVASVNRGHNELISDGENGFFFHNENDLIKILKQLYKDVELKMKIRENNIQKVDQYVTEKIIKEMEVIYTNILEN